MPQTYYFDRALADDQRTALLAFRDTSPAEVPADVMDKITGFIVDNSGGFQAITALVKAVWDAGPDINTELMAIAAAQAEWLHRNGFGDFGKPRNDPSAMAARIAAGLMRDSGMSAPGGGWPTTEEDPQRGTPAPPPLPEMGVPPVLPGDSQTPAPEATTQDEPPAEIPPVEPAP